MEYVHGSLERLQTDYIDILLIHAVGDARRHGGPGPRSGGGLSRGHRQA